VRRADRSLDLHREAGIRSVLRREAGDVGKRSALGVAVLACLFVLATAVPAHAAPRHLRLYRGDTSQGEHIRFKVERTDAGRVVREISVSHVTLTCPDQTTLEFGFGFGFGGNSALPITDKEFSFDDVFWESAFHIAGELGSLQGQGTFSKAQAVITPDEQAAQLCTSGDLTWNVEFVRTL
jgi:hypothetical protein